MNKILASSDLIQQLRIKCSKGSHSFWFPQAILSKINLSNVSEKALNFFKEVNLFDVDFQLYPANSTIEQWVYNNIPLKEFFLVHEEDSSQKNGIEFLVSNKCELNQESIDFIDLKKQFFKLYTPLKKSLNEVLFEGRFIMGPQIESLEERLADFVNAKFCVSCSSGTDGLLMSLMALELKAGDAVITTPFTFIATAEAISLVGAHPVFSDIDPDTYNLSPSSLEKTIIQERKENKRTIKAIIVANLFGLTADFDRINAIANKYNIAVIEDAAQSFGAKYKNKSSCSLSKIGVTSFFPAKPLGCYGDGGAIFTDDREIYRKLISIRVHGKETNKYSNVRVGLNSRLDTIQAAILMVKLKTFDEELAEKNSIAKVYHKKISDKFKKPFVPNLYSSAWAQYTIRHPLRDKIVQSITGFRAQIYYPTPLHLQKVYKDLGYQKGDFPNAELCSDEVFSIPLHAYLTDENIQTIISELNRIS